MTTAKALASQRTCSPLAAVPFQMCKPKDHSASNKNPAICQLGITFLGAVTRFLASLGGKRGEPVLPKPPTQGTHRFDDFHGLEYLYQITWSLVQVSQLGPQADILSADSLPVLHAACCPHTDNAEHAQD